MFLGLDLGTTNVKAVLADAKGRAVGRGSAPVAVLHVGGDGIEQDVEEIWSAALQAVRGAVAGADGQTVQAVGVSSQGGALQVVGRDGRPVGRVVSWMDGRARRYSEEVTRRLGTDWFAAHVGHGSGGVAAGQVLRLRRESPGLIEGARRVGFVGDVAVERLCGHAAHDATSLSIALLFNPSLGKADPDLLRELDLEEGQLPALLPARAWAGGLREELATALSLRAGIPVSPAVHDQYAAALGCGAVRGGDVMFGAGTAWVLLAAAGRLMRPVIPAAFVCTHVAEGLYGQMLSLVNGGSSYAWAAGLLGLEGRRTQEMDDVLGRIPPGAEGLRFWPLLAPGGGAGLAPGTAGRLSGLRLSHTAAHVLRAVVEGLALELARYLRFLTGAGVGVRRLVMCGGGAAGQVTPQIVADVTGVEVACCSEPDTSALGAAVIARGLVDRAAGLAELSQAMAPPLRVVEPGPHSAFYHELLEEYLASLPLVREGAPA